MSIIDSSVKPKNVTLNNGASISTLKSRFGGGSLSLSGRSDYAPNGGGPYAYIDSNTDFGFGTGDFTIEMWVYPLDFANWRTLISIGRYDDGLLWRMGPGGDQLYINGVGYAGQNNNSNWGASNVTINKWSHLALVRNSGTVKVYINGTESFSASGGPVASDLGSSRDVYIGTGKHSYGSEIFNGYIDEIRITKGIGAARYSSNFDVKTLLAPFPSTGTPITPPEGISNLSALAIDQRVDLSWNPPAEDNGGIITDYSFQYTTDDPTNNPTYYQYNHTASSAPSGSISGLVNGTTYSVRVAPINVAGTGSYVSQSNVVPILPPVLSITQEPLNNRVTASNESATFSISAELTNNTNNSSFSYQWQKYDFVFGPNYDIYDFRWNDISNSNSSSININTNAFESYYYGSTGTGPIRCILTSPYETKMSRTVRLVDAASSLNGFYFYIDYMYQNGNYATVGGNYYNGYNSNSNQRINIYIDNYLYPVYDDSWYTGNDTRLKFQYSLDGLSWSDVDSTYSYNFRKNNYSTYNNIQTPAMDLSGRVYFRIILEDLWPYSTHNGTNSTTESTYSRVVSYYFIDYSPSTPGTPSSVVADPGDGLAIVSWNAPTLTGGAPITSYTIQYSSNSGSSWTTFGTSSSTSANVTGLSNGTSYLFKVSATNGAGTGSYSSNSSSVTPDAANASVPGSPTNITGIAGNTKVLLNWIAPSNIGKSVLTDYVVQYSTDDGETWENYIEPSPTPTPTSTPTIPTSSKITVARGNGGASTFTGLGTAASPLTRAARVLNSNADGLIAAAGDYVFTVTSSGTAYVTVTFYDDDNDSNYGFIRINGTIIEILGHGDTVTARSFSVVAGDVITFHCNYTYTSFSNVSVWVV